MISTCSCVVDKVALLQLALVNSHVGELAVFSLLQFEGQPHEGVSVGPLWVQLDRDLTLLSGLFVHAGLACVNGQVCHLRRIRQVVHDRVQ